MLAGAAVFPEPDDFELPFDEADDFLEVEVDVEADVEVELPELVFFLLPVFEAVVVSVVFFDEFSETALLEAVPLASLVLLIAFSAASFIGVTVFEFIVLS